MRNVHRIYNSHTDFESQKKFYSWQKSKNTKMYTLYQYL